MFAVQCYSIYSPSPPAVCHWNQGRLQRETEEGGAGEARGERWKEKGLWTLDWSHIWWSSRERKKGTRGKSEEGRNGQGKETDYRKGCEREDRRAWRGQRGQNALIYLWRAMFSFICDWLDSCCRTDLISLWKCKDLSKATVKCWRKLFSSVPCLPNVVLCFVICVVICYNDLRL